VLYTERIMGFYNSSNSVNYVKILEQDDVFSKHFYVLSDQTTFPSYNWNRLLKRAKKKKNKKKIKKFEKGPDTK